MKSFKKKLDLTFTILLDEKQGIGATYGVRAIPTTYIIDREGWILGAAIGAREWSVEDSLDLFRVLLDSKGGR